MKTLLITGILFVSGLYAAVAFQNNEIQNSQALSQRWDTNRIIDSLKREIRFGPKPFCVLHPTAERTAESHDSIMRYYSHLTVGELREVKDGITENVALKDWLDTLLSYKDSLHYAMTGNHDLYTDD